MINEVITMILEEADKAENRIEEESKDKLYWEGAHQVLCYIAERARKIRDKRSAIDKGACGEVFDLNCWCSSPKDHKEEHVCECGYIF